LTLCAHTCLLLLEVNFIFQEAYLKRLIGCVILRIPWLNSHCAK